MKFGIDRVFEQSVALKHLERNQRSCAKRTIGNLHGHAVSRLKADDKNAFSATD
jgi:hypothetical protein